jgi:hypothetical protein
VEPVLGTLLNFMGIRKIITKGLGLAHKEKLLAASAYNLRKLMRFTQKRVQTGIMALPRPDQQVLFKASLAQGVENSSSQGGNNYCSSPLAKSCATATSVTL